MVFDEQNLKTLKLNDPTKHCFKPSAQFIADQHPPPHTHWALGPREVILKSQIWKIWKLAKSYNV